ncbi:MAG: PQQ-dependent sugar dehydrogenase [Acidobacteriota bacterium]|nr:PQQ-dependent sugar dehydrogenase [Acidobacteriota bacterium]
MARAAPDGSALLELARLGHQGVVRTTGARRRSRWAALAAGALVLSCGLLARAQNPRDRHNPGPEPFARRVVATGLANPWEVTWGPDGQLWITERTGFRVTRINPADGSTRVALELDDVYQSVEQDGLLGMALHPGLLKGQGVDHVFVAYTYDRDPGPGVTRRIRIRRYTYDDRSQQLEAPLDVLTDMPAHDDHGGGRLAIGPDGMLYFTRGDLGSNFLANVCNPNRAQDLPTADQIRVKDWSTYQGKILRLSLDGSIPRDNPVLAGVRSHIYTYGHRNPQGLAFSPSRRLYASDHGPSTDDEVDLIVPGKNYGWPHVAGFQDDQSYVYANWSASTPTPCSALTFDNLHPPASVAQYKESAWRHPDFVAPIATLFTVPAGYDFAAFGNATVAPAGLEVYAASAIPTWANSILVTGMRTGAVYRLKLDGDGTGVVGAPTEYFRAANRYRDLAVSPDGRRIFLVTDSKGITLDASGRRTETLANPGAVLELTYTGPRAQGGR